VRDTPLVIKFGGTSVGGGAQFVRAAKIAAEAAQSRPVTVVVSARSGTTDTLLGYADITTGATNRPTSTGATHEGSVAELHRTLSERHLRAAREAVSMEHLPGVEDRLQVLLERLIEAINEPAENPAARRAAIAVYGERLSAEILAGAISSAGPSAGPPASVVEGDPIATDARFDEAEVDAAETRARCSRHVAPLLAEGVVAVVPGYVGRSPDGLPTTLGRGGSDLSATVVGRALGSEEVWIMSDVDGVLDADPRLVPDATLMPHLSYRVAGLFAALGAKVLHPKTMEPASEAGIEVRVRNTFNLECSGTRVTEREDDEGIRCVALRRRFAVELPCASRRHQKKAAAVIGIGSPEKGDLERGLKSLQEAGISPLHAGPTTAGLVFVVVPEAAEVALRALHSRLITPAAEVVA
jgi:aspartate kinase